MNKQHSELVAVAKELIDDEANRAFIKQPEYYAQKFGTALRLPASDFDYIAETDKTASNVFTPENVSRAELAILLQDVIRTAARMDHYKKALFRKRSRAESNLEELPEGILLLSQLPALAAPGIHDDLFHGIIGNITEVGEQAEILLAFLNGERVDITNVREEMGDNLWYLSRLAKYANTTIEAEMVRNIQKLRARHGEGGFNKERDIARDLDEERQVLEGGHE